jgi:hypothetical protein
MAMVIPVFGYGNCVPGNSKKKLCSGRIISPLIIVISIFLILLSSFLSVAGQDSGSFPVISLISPGLKDSFNNTGRILVRAEIKSTLPLKKFTIFHNDEVAGDERNLKTSRSDSITYILETQISLQEGLNVVYVEARNTVGKASSEKRNVDYRLKPFINWVIPGSENSETKSEILQVRAKIFSGFPLKQLSISINNADQPVDIGSMVHQDEKNSYFETTARLKPGRNNIVITASNLQGITRSTTRQVTFIQGEAPVISLISPSESDSVNSSGRILVKASIVSESEVKSLRIFNNDRITGNEQEVKPVRQDSMTYIVETFIPLVRGRNEIYLDAKNTIGRVSSEKRVVTGRLGLYVNWLAPFSSTSSSKLAYFTVKAEIVSDYDIKDVFINLNGEDLITESENLNRHSNNLYSFEKTIRLVPGINNLYISATGDAGTERSTARIINFYQGSKPLITIVSPGLEDTLNSSGRTLLRAEIFSNTEIKAFAIYHNDQIAADESVLSPSRLDSVTYLIETFIPVARGQNIFYVEARNSEGKTISENRSITGQLESFVNWIEPAPVSSDTRSATLLVKANIISDYDLTNVSINLNGKELKLRDDEIVRLNEKRYSFEKTVQLSPGENILYISTSSMIGVSKSTSRLVNFYQGSEPVITLLSPVVKDSLNNSGMVLLSAEIESGSELQEIRIYHNKTVETAKQYEHKDSTTYTFKSLFPLKAGLNTFYIEAKNYIGTAVSEKRNIICQLEPIINWITPETLNSNAADGVVTIKAEIKTCLDLLNIGINVNGISRQQPEFTRLNNDTYVFETALSLDPGSNNIVISAENAKGTGYSKKSYISYVGMAKSEIRWKIPAETNSESSKPEFIVTANIRTKSQIKDTRLSLNGLESPKNNRKKVTQINNQEYLYENTVTLQQGLNAIELSVITDAGAINSEMRIINYVPPARPVLAWKIPESVRSDINKTSLNMSMNIKSDSPLDTIIVYLNGKALENISLPENTRKENGQFVLEDTVPLIPGENNIYVVAGNSGGRATSEIRNIRYIIPPKAVIAWKKPESSAPVSSDKLSLEAGISSRTPLSDVRLYINGKELNDKPVITKISGQQGEYLAGITLDLNKGTNYIYLVAENSSGKAESETLSINYIPPSAPSVTWINPSNDNTDSEISSPEIHAVISSGSRPESVLLYVNGKGSEQVTKISPGNLPGEYILRHTINLGPGENIIYLAVTNSFGSTKSLSRYITNPNTVPPAITWSIPSSDSTVVNSEIFLIEACIKSATELKSAQIIVNGVQMASEMVFQKPTAGTCNYIFSKSVILKEGDNRVFIIAENFAGSNRSDKRLIKFQPGITEKRLALVIGNADYANSMPLMNPVNDANLMEGTLKNLGFDVIKYINVTRDNMSRAFRDFTKKITDYNVILFYYAGHGMQVDGQNYLIPTDAILKEPSDCKWEALLVRDIIEEFERIPDNTNIVILDACRDNPFRSWSRGGYQGFRIMNAASGTLISYATSENSRAVDGTGKNGVFTEELVKQMVIPQSIYQVFNNTRRQVMKRTNNQQVPTESYTLTGDFYFKK